MLTKLHLRNFRCFEDHTVEFGPVTALVGPNNAGKSTVIEALRFVALAARRARTAEFFPAPDWCPEAGKGLRPSLSGIDVDFEGLYYMNRKPPAEVEAEFLSGDRVRVYLGGPERALVHAHAVFVGNHGDVLWSRRGIEALSLPPISILPQIGPLSPHEKVLDDKTVRRGRSSRLSSLHFRNELRVLDEFFAPFCLLAETSWPDLQVEPPLVSLERMDGDLRLPIHDGPFTAEVGHMGHGMQMWLQTMWFLAQAPGGATVILDEPDVYMHPDLQLRLMRMLRAKHPQCIISTHSVEIITEVSPSEVVPIDRNAATSRPLTSLAALQWVVDAIGAPHNLALMRLGTSQRFLLVEGKDALLLERFRRVLFPDAQETFQTIPHVEIGGWGGWDWASRNCVPKTANSRGEKILTYCVLDRDYHTQDECADRYAQAKKCGVSLLIWPRKEIESYLLVPAAIARALQDHTREGRTEPSLEEVSAALMAIADGLEGSVTESMAEAIEHRNRGWGISKCMKEARGLVRAGWGTLDGRLRLVPGRGALKLLRQWAAVRCGVTITDESIVRAMTPNEIPDEMREVITAIADCRWLRRKAAWE